MLETSQRRIKGFEKKADELRDTEKKAPTQVTPKQESTEPPITKTAPINTSINIQINEQEVPVTTTTSTTTTTGGFKKRRRRQK